MGETQFRSKIYWLTFCFSLMVVWVHSYNWELFLGQTLEGNAVALVERIFGESLGQMAVPGFFLVSGYLFFRTFALKGLLGKWGSRVRTVALPYVLWNLLYYAGYFLASRLPFLESVLNRGTVPLDGKTLVEAAFFNLYTPVFWYLHQLIFLVLLAPVLYFLLKRDGSAALFMAFLVWAIYANRRLGPLNTDALFYYGTGAWAGLHRKDSASFAESGEIKKWLVPGAVLGLWAAAVWILSRPGGILHYNPLTAVTCRLTMAVGSWILISVLPLPEAKEYTKHSFFLYAIHFALVRLFNKAGALMFPGSAGAALLFFFAMPFVMVPVSLGLGRLLGRVLPPVYRILTGGR